MKIFVTLTPAEIAQLPATDLAQRTCVVFDVLRATSTIVTALQHGVCGIYPAADLAEALLLKQQYPGALLGGERQGEKIEGFDLGNAPLEYLEQAGREIISTTTNGTVALRACAGAREILAASLLNVAATGRHLRENGTENVQIICAGTGCGFALEDAIGGGALMEALVGCEMDDAGTALLELWQQARRDLFSAFQRASNGRRLIAAGRAEEVRWCAQVDVFSVVARLEGNCLRAVPAPWKAGGASRSA